MEWLAEPEKRGQSRRLTPCLKPRGMSSDTARQLSSPWRGTEGSNPCTLQSGYWLVGIVDWPDRAGLPGVARESQCFEIIGRRTVVLGATSPKNDVAGHWQEYTFTVDGKIFDSSRIRRR
jgi:hypothetical protein